MVASGAATGRAPARACLHRGHDAGLRGQRHADLRPMATCQWDACTGQACSGDASQACGNCGTQGRMCTNGTWSAWSACTGESTVCTSGATQACMVGDQPGAETCDTTTCVWDACVACSGPAQQPCGNCGTQSRTCGANGNWNDFGPCTGEGMCVAGTTQACSTSGYFQTCDLATCQWDACVTCSGAAQQPCGNCGTQSRTCSSGVWSAWGTCGGEGACVAGSDAGAARAGRRRADTTTCQCGTGAPARPARARAPARAATAARRPRRVVTARGSGERARGRARARRTLRKAAGRPADRRRAAPPASGERAAASGRRREGCGQPGNSGQQFRTCNDGTWSACGAPWRRRPAARPARRKPARWASRTRSRAAARARGRAAPAPTTPRAPTRTRWASRSRSGVDAAGTSSRSARPVRATATSSVPRTSPERPEAWVRRSLRRSP